MKEKIQLQPKNRFIYTSLTDMHKQQIEVILILMKNEQLTCFLTKYIEVTNNYKISTNKVMRENYIPIKSALFVDVLTLHKEVQLTLMLLTGPSTRKSA